MRRRTTIYAACVCVLRATDVNGAARKLCLPISDEHGQRDALAVCVGGGGGGSFRSVRKTITQFFVCQIKLLKFTTAVPVQHTRTHTQTHTAAGSQHAVRNIATNTTGQSRPERLLILLQRLGRDC